MLKALLDWLDRLKPSALVTTPRERLRAILGAGIGILCTALASLWFGGAAAPWLVAPMGASAVLVFSAPSSPLAQPWAVVGGNTLSALIGLVCSATLAPVPVAAAVAVAVAIALMMITRSLHPPGGAVALLVVLTPALHWSFAFFPVMLNSLILVSMGMLYNSLSGHSYPHRMAPALEGALRNGPRRFTREDLETAITHYDEVLDIAPDELARMLARAESSAYQRLWGSVLCKDVMTPNPVTVGVHTPLPQAWRRMRDLQIKALPVVNQSGHVLGIVTQADFLKHARLDEHDGLAGRLQDFIMPADVQPSPAVPTVSDIMTRTIRVATADRRAAELLPVFSGAGHHHLPIIDENKRLVGILTQTDLVRALSRAVQPDPATG